MEVLIRSPRLVMPLYTTAAAAEVQQIFRARRDDLPWLDEPAALARLAVLLRDLPIDECIALGFSFKKNTNTLGQAEIKTPGPAVLPDGLMILQDSDSHTHRAMLWHRTGAQSVDLWVDGRAIALPVDESGTLGTNFVGAWRADRFFALEIIPEEHPLQDWSRPFSRGVQRALLIVDTLTGRPWIEMPGPEELWELPLLELADSNCLLLYADATARDAGRVSRTIPLSAA